MLCLGTVQQVDQDGRIELTLQLWGRDDPDAFEEYLDALVQLLPRTNGVLERRDRRYRCGGWYSRRSARCLVSRQRLGRRLVARPAAFGSRRTSLNERLLIR